MLSYIEIAEITGRSVEEVRGAMSEACMASRAYWTSPEDAGEVTYWKVGGPYSGAGNTRLDAVVNALTGGRAETVRPWDGCEVVCVVNGTVAKFWRKEYGDLDLVRSFDMAQTRISEPTPTDAFEIVDWYGYARSNHLY